MSTIPPPEPAPWHRRTAAPDHRCAPAGVRYLPYRRRRRWAGSGTHSTTTATKDGPSPSVFLFPRPALWKHPISPDGSTRAKADFPRPPPWPSPDQLRLIPTTSSAVSFPGQPPPEFPLPPRNGDGTAAARVLGLIGLPWPSPSRSFPGLPGSSGSSVRSGLARPGGDCAAPTGCPRTRCRSGRGGGPTVSAGSSPHQARRDGGALEGSRVRAGSACYRHEAAIIAPTLQPPRGGGQVTTVTHCWPSSSAYPTPLWPTLRGTSPVRMPLSRQGEPVHSLSWRAHDLYDNWALKIDSDTQSERTWMWYDHGLPERI